LAGTGRRGAVTASLYGDAVERVEAVAFDAVSSWLTSLDDRRSDEPHEQDLHGVRGATRYIRTRWNDGPKALVNASERR